MGAGAKFFVAMFAWAAFCRLAMEALPRNPPPAVLIPFILVSILGLVWIPAKVAWGFGDANKITSMTVYVWIGTAIVALLVILALGL